MPIYRCYFLDYQNHIEAAEDLQAEHLDHAIERASTILKMRPDYDSIEIWQGTLRLYGSRRYASGGPQAQNLDQARTGTSQALRGRGRVPATAKNSPVASPVSDRETDGD